MIEYHSQNSTDHIWRMQSLFDPDFSLSTKTTKTGYPLGRHNWTIEGDDLCTKPIGHHLELTLSTCSDTQFSCDDGSCIDLRNRLAIHAFHLLFLNQLFFLRLKCDNKVDCPSGRSDEAECAFMRTHDTYFKSIPPPRTDDEDAPVNVDVIFDVQSITSIETVEAAFTMDFRVLLMWRDARISFFDLNEEVFANTLSLADLNSVWYPTLIFANALGK